MYSILTLNKISKAGYEVLSDDYVVSDSVSNPDAILVRSASLANIEFTGKLKAIARAGTGTNNIPVDRCSKNGIVVFNTPGANARSVEELVICALIMSARKVPDSVGWLNKLDCSISDLDKYVEKHKSLFAGRELAGKTLGIIGLGAIGTLVARSALSLGMNVLGFDPYVPADLSSIQKITRVKSLEQILSKSDYISLHVPLTKITKNMINSDTIKKIKPGAHLLNYSRADIVDVDAVLDAVRKKALSTFATDFPKKQLLNQPNIIVTPHLGASTRESEDNCSIMAFRQIQDFLENGNITNSVNFPNVKINRCESCRICLFFNDSPVVIPTVLKILERQNVNIKNMQSQSKNDFAYALIDVDGNISKCTFDSIAAIENIIRFRVID